MRPRWRSASGESPSSRANALRVRRHSARQISRSGVSSPLSSRLGRRARDDRAARDSDRSRARRRRSPRAPSRSTSSCRSSPSTRFGVRSDRVGVGHEPLHQHVEVARGPERAAEPADLVTERLRPRRLEKRPPRPEEGAQTPGGHAELMEVLRVRAEPDARVVEQQAPRLLAERDPEGGARRRSAGHRSPPRRQEGDRGRGTASAAARPASVAPARRSSFTSRRSVRSSPPTSSTSSSRKRRVTRCPESRATESSTTSAPSTSTTSRRVRSRATGANSRPRRNATSSDESSSGGRAGGPALLELGAARPTRELELPEARSLLDPVAERDAVPREHEVVRVVVRRDEHARRKRLAAQLRQDESLAGSQLHLPLEGLLHPPSVSGRGPPVSQARCACLVSVNVRARAPVADAEDERVLRALRQGRRERARGRAARRPPLP